MPEYRFAVTIEQDEDGWFVAECPALAACYTQGATPVEALERMRDAIDLCLRDLCAEDRLGGLGTGELLGVRTLDVNFEGA